MEYIGLPQKEAFDIEYWALEEAKLQRMPPEREFARKVVIVVGAGSGIGKEMAHVMIDQGAHVVCADLNQETAQATAEELIAKVGSGYRGSRDLGFPVVEMPSGSPVMSPIVRRSRQCLLKLFMHTVASITFAVTAGIFVPPDRTGHIPDDKWGLTFGINVAGPYFVADESD